MAKPARQGQRWTKEEDDQLVQDLAVAELSLEEIAERHQRSLGGILAHKQVLAVEEVLAGRPMDEETVARYRLSEEEVIQVADEVELAQTGELKMSTHLRRRARPRSKSMPNQEGKPKAAKKKATAPKKKTLRVQLDEALEQVATLTQQLADQAEELQALDTQRLQLIETVFNLSRPSER